MKSKKIFKSLYGSLPLPVFFPDATKAVLKTLDSADIENTQTPGILINTYHLYQDLGRKILKHFGGIRPFMSWKRALISDSGGFQVMSLAKKFNKRGSVTDRGVTFQPPGGQKVHFTPEESIEFQMEIKPDMVVALDDFTDPSSTYEEARETVERTILWAKICKKEFERIVEERKIEEKDRPYLLAIAQGGEFLDLRHECTKRLAEIGFDGLGYGGWPAGEDGKFSYDTVKAVADETPKNCLLYALGIGRPDEIVGCTDFGYDIFDCVLPTRDARHGRLYVFEANSMDEINIRAPKFYSYLSPDKEKYYDDHEPVSKACDCLLCRRYSRSYLAHLFKIEDTTALRLSTIHNLRFYSLLMEKIREEKV